MINMGYWMKFIKSDDGEVFEMLAEKSPQIKKAVGILKELSADERARMIYEDQEKARRDIASMMGGARREGRLEGQRKERCDIAQKLLSIDMAIEKIIEITGLSQDEISSLKI
jgi:predicted transposase/invertase (TIGR01784 family)